MKDTIKEAVIKKYNLPESWEWFKSTRQNIEGGMLVSGKCKMKLSGMTDEEIKHSHSKTYFLPDSE